MKKEFKTYEEAEKYCCSFGLWLNKRNPSLIFCIAEALQRAYNSRKKVKAMTDKYIKITEKELDILDDMVKNTERRKDQILLSLSFIVGLRRKIHEKYKESK